MSLTDLTQTYPLYAVAASMCETSIQRRGADFQESVPEPFCARAEAVADSVTTLKPNHYMKKYLRTLAMAGVLLCAATSARGETGKFLQINYKDGTSANVGLTSQPHVGVAGENLTVRHDNGEMSVALATVVNFKGVELSGIDDVAVASPTVRWVSPTEISVTGAAEVRVFTLGGVEVLAAKGDTTINLTDYPESYLIIKADNKTFKITGK